MVSSLKKENAAVAAQLEQKSGEAKDLARKVAELTQERNEIRNRVEKILSRLENIEL
jgi:FtsZ-binding cell division protein ZapB